MMALAAFDHVVPLVASQKFSPDVDPLVYRRSGRLNVEPVRKGFHPGPDQLQRRRLLRVPVRKLVDLVGDAHAYTA